MQASGVPPRGRFVILVVALGLLVAQAPSRAEPVPCRDVLGELNRRVSRGMSREVERIAKSLRCEPDWVAQCLRSHGRRVEHAKHADRPEDEPTEIVEPVFDPNELEPELEPRSRVKKIR